MRLDYDCVRELLFVLEEHLEFGENLHYDDKSFIEILSYMPDYSKEDVAYTTLKLQEAGYIDVSISGADNSFYSALYRSITYEGHQYLDSVRDSDVWKSIKNHSKALTFHIIKRLAETIALAKFNS